MSLIHNATFDSQTRVLSLLDKAGNVISSCEVPSKGDPLTLTATADNSSVKLIKNGTLSNTYEVNTGSGWTAYEFDTVIPLNAGQSCKWRCSAHPTAQSYDRHVKFVMTGTIEASGNCNSMLSSDFENITSLSVYSYAFSDLFRGCTSLTQAPELPATTLASSCYSSMFRGCTSLTQAPELPATTLASSCYTSMFYGCTSLKQAPELPATTLASSCYSSMFRGCTSLTQAPELPATTLASSCYYYMFYGCTSLTQAPELPATTGESNCYDYMFYGCTGLTQAPSIHLTAGASCNYMFNGCTSLTVAPDLPATSGKYTGMFEGCTSLTTPPTISLTAMNGDYTCEEMFKGCTSLTYSPKLPVKYLQKYSYYRMFDGCSNLSEVCCGATRISSRYDYCLDDWLWKVAPTGLFYCDPTSTIFPLDSEDGIPENWKRLTFVYDAVDTGTTATMYHNGVTETVRVGTSAKYGNCYAFTGGHFFNTLSDMHKLGYSFGAPTTITLYRFEEPISAYCVAANEGDGSVPLYDTGDGNGWLTIERQNERGVYIASKVFTGLTLTATSNDSSVKLTNAYDSSKVHNRFMVNAGSGWQFYTEGTLINLSIGQTCQWYCYEFNETQISSIHYSPGKFVKFTMTGTIEASGNCNSMLSGNFEGITSLSRYESAFCSLFIYCKSLTKAPDLPATALKKSCYERMFCGCKSLVQAPVLPATELDSYCYEEMFEGCTALVQPPVLPATTLTNNCYTSMFRNCTSLTRAPELPATALPHACYYNMFNGCTSLAEVRIAATTKESKAQYVLDNWLSGVSATGDFYCDPNATIFPTDSASGIPSGWVRRNIADYPATP